MKKVVTIICSILLLVGFFAGDGYSGVTLEFSTFLGGTDDGSGAYGIAVDAAGNIYVGGNTGTSDFPTVNAYDSTNSSQLF